LSQPPKYFRLLDELTTTLENCFFQCFYRLKYPIDERLI